MEYTSISDVEKHGHKYVVHQVQSDAISKQGIPHHQQVLERKLPAKQQTNPPTKHTQTNRVIAFLYSCGWRKEPCEPKVLILTCHRFEGRSPAGWDACAALCHAFSLAGPGYGWLWSLWQQMALHPEAERMGCWSASLPYPRGADYYITGLSL